MDGLQIAVFSLFPASTGCRAKTATMPLACASDCALRMFRGEEGTSVEHHESALELEPDDVEIRHNPGMALERMHRE